MQDKDIEMQYRSNEGESVVPGRFIRILKYKIYKYMASVSRDVHIDRLDHIVNNCNNVYNSTIKMKPVDVKSSSYIDFKIEK